MKHLKVLLTLLFLISGCASLNTPIQTQLNETGQISIYISIPEKVSNQINLDIFSMSVISNDNTKKEILKETKNIDSFRLKNNQILICDSYIKEGQYKGIELLIKNIFLKKLNKNIPLSTKSEPLIIDYIFNIKRGENTSLFLKWDPDSSLANEGNFIPSFSISSTTPELSSLMLYVTNEGSNSVSVINRQTNNVVANILVGDRPRGIAVSQLNIKPRIFVANSGSNTISIIDPTKNKLEFNIPIRYGSEPEGITVTKVLPDKELIIVSNFASDNISIIDGSTYEKISKINVGNGPIAVVADPDIETLSRSRITNIEDINILRNYRKRYLNIYVANKNSRNISIIKWDILEKRAQDVTNINVEWSPIALAIDNQRLKLYIANYNSDNLSVIDIVQIIKGNTSGSISTITNVGSSIIGLLPDPDLDRLYLIKELTGEIISIRPPSELFSMVRSPLTIAPVIDSVKVGSLPRSLILDPERRRLYVVNKGDGSISVIDKTTNKVEKIITVGNNPYGIAMFDY